MSSSCTTCKNSLSFYQALITAAFLYTASPVSANPGDANLPDDKKFPSLLNNSSQSPAFKQLQILFMMQLVCFLRPNKRCFLQRI